MTDPTPSSADVIEGMREALVTDEMVRVAVAAADDYYEEECDKIDFEPLSEHHKSELMRRALAAALALPDSKPDKGGA